MKKAIFPGSFDPFTLGHHSIVKRALVFMDGVIVGVGIHNGKQGLIPVEKRVEMIRRLYADEPRVKVEAYSGLTVDFAREQGAEFIVRGIRSVKERSFCLPNRSWLQSARVWYGNCCIMVRMSACSCRKEWNYEKNNPLGRPDSLLFFNRPITGTEQPQLCQVGCTQVADG